MENLKLSPDSSATIAVDSKSHTTMENFFLNSVVLLTGSIQVDDLTPIIHGWVTLKGKTRVESGDRTLIISGTMFKVKLQYSVSFAVSGTEVITPRDQ